MTTIQSEDRRKSSRMKGRKEAILIHPNGMGLGGLSFHCPLDEFFPVQWPIEIIFAGTLLYMKGMPVRLIRERMDEVVSIMSTPTKEVGVEFLNLDEEKLIVIRRMIAYLREGPTN